MDIIRVPGATNTQPQLIAGDISFVSYRDGGGTFRNRVLFDQFAFSFVQNGQKQIYLPANHTVLSAGQGMLIPQGNSIIAEHSDNSKPYHSIIIFFPAQLGQLFAAKHLPTNTSTAPPYIHFDTNAYLSAYILNLQQLIESGIPLSAAVGQHKLYELLLVMAELYPKQLAAMFAHGAQISLKGLVENNLFSRLTLEELAFLANRSLSSFKRDFEKAYGIPPQRYIRERKLELALTELIQGKSPAELYTRYGYESISNFATAFKRRYGYPPVAYRQIIAG